MTAAQTASRLLKKGGEAVVMRYTRPGTVNPATGTGTPDTPVNHGGFGYPGQYESKDVDGTNILATDIRLVLEKIAERPQPGWTATIDGTTYRVMKARPVRKAGVDVIYICQLRK